MVFAFILVVNVSMMVGLACVKNPISGHKDTTVSFAHFASIAAKVEKPKSNRPPQHR